MIEWLKKDSFYPGLVLGFISCTLIVALLKGLNAGFAWIAGRELLLKPDTIPLVTLATMAIGFRWLIITRKQSHTARGFFFSLFVSTLVYLLNRKFQFASLI